MGNNGNGNGKRPSRSLPAVTMSSLVERKAGRPAPWRSKFSGLSKTAIREYMKQGLVVIDPFTEEGLGTNSYDVHLGPYFFREQHFPASSRRVLNPFDHKHIEKYWGPVEKPTLAKEWEKENGDLENIFPDDPLIVLDAGETILAHTIEFIGGRECVCCKMFAKSTAGRVSITVCKCAGLSSVGFCNRWTMEMTNHMEELRVVLVVGMPIAQIAFEQVDPVQEADSYAKAGGHYQDTDDLEEMKRTWTPQLMLPRFERKNFLKVTY